MILFCSDFVYVAYLESFSELIQGCFTLIFLDRMQVVISLCKQQESIIRVPLYVYTRSNSQVSWYLPG